MSRKQPSPNGRRLLLALLTIVIAALAISSVRLDSATADEGAHIASGIIKLRYGWLSFFAEQPPLMNVISALPLGSFTMPDTWRADLGTRGHWAAGHALLYESGNDAYRLLFLARLPTIALLLALCFVVYFVVAAEAGPWWGVIAFALTGFCPNLLAHGRLATVDLAVTAFGFIAFAFLLFGLRQRQLPLSLLAGVFAMCAVLSKTSGVLFAPLFLFLFWRTRAWKHFLPTLLASIATLYIVTFALAGDQYLAQQFPDTPRILIPWLQYKQHADAIRFWYERGHENPQFLLGQFSKDGWPHYYFVAFLLKTPLPAIILFVLAVVAALKRRSLAVDASLFFIALFFAISTTSKIALGIRYILPIYPFVYTAIAISLARVVVEKRRAIAVGVLVAWHCIAS
ncbi:MAG: ArnT family glycosyltransferase, partial [Thermoanaerobaculia bacterium]